MHAGGRPVAPGREGETVRTLIRPCLLAALGGALVALPTAFGDLVDLSFDPDAQTVLVDDLVEIDLIASSSGDTTQLFAALEAILHWDPAYLDLVGVDDSGAGYDFLDAHFLPDPDGINDDLHDGDALFVALAPGGEEAPAPPGGLIVTTLLFQALTDTEATIVDLLPSLGMYGVTRIRRLDLSDVTGDISGTATVTILACGTGDADEDGDVDLVDMASFQRCFTGASGGPPDPICGCRFDFEPDMDIDFADFEELVDRVSGPGS